MKERIFKDGNRCSVTEYEVRTIDAHGDSDEILYFDTPSLAIKSAEQLVKDGKALAAVAEKHIQRFPAHRFNEPNEFVILATFGNGDALDAGGWTK